MGRPPISLSEEHAKIIKEMHNKGDNFFKLYRQVLNWDYNMKEATFKRILSTILKNDDHSPTQENGFYEWCYFKSRTKKS
ncbi:hypothetical protein [Crassaminicella profunda]|uniref:hypothetical protein n=1 Tax=Crassaminicella profunda TaxID=1286698 RepID=UPI001CA65E91|nr:hypothetical protein [Crassaminicella profunda]QZY56844.1 hypothetical protein K7H06_07970 [Crassaminicella profunda]